MDKGLLTLTLDSDLAPTWDVTTIPGGPPMDMTGWPLEFVIRRLSDNALVLSTTAVTVSDGVGTGSRATAAISHSDLTGWAFGTLYYGTLWRLPVGAYAPLWADSVRIERTAARP